MRRQDRNKHQVDWADVIRSDGTHEGWRLDAHGMALLEDGWEPFAVSNVSIYRPELDPPVDTYSERVWFRRAR